MKTKVLNVCGFLYCNLGSYIPYIPFATHRLISTFNPNFTKNFYEIKIDVGGNVHPKVKKVHMYGSFFQPTTQLQQISFARSSCILVQGLNLQACWWNLKFYGAYQFSRLEISAYGLDSTLSVTTIKGVINIKANHHFEQFSFWVVAHHRSTFHLEWIL